MLAAGSRRDSFPPRSPGVACGRAREGQSLQGRSCTMNDLASAAGLAGRFIRVARDVMTSAWSRLRRVCDGGRPYGC